MIDTIKFGTLKWHHVLSPTEEDLDFLKENFYFHPLDIEDCRSKVQRPKIDIYDEYYFLILHFPYYDQVNKFLKTKEVKIFWGEDYIITIGKSHWVVKTLFNSMKENPQLNEDFVATSDALLYKILERLMTETLALINKVGREVDAISAQLFDDRAQKTIELISITRRNIILLNTIFKPQLRLFHKFESGDISGYAENMEDYWGNILDYYQKMWDLIEDYAELIEDLSKTFDSLQTNRINSIMKVLTLISSILLPLTFITGIYGMNFDTMPFISNPHSFWILLAGMSVIVISMILYFKRKGWM